MRPGVIAIITSGDDAVRHLAVDAWCEGRPVAELLAACAELEAAKLQPSLMVDCSHANSSKQHQRQIDVARDIDEEVERTAEIAEALGHGRHVQDLVVARGEDVVKIAAAVDMGVHVQIIGPHLHFGFKFRSQHN